MIYLTEYTSSHILIEYSNNDSSILSLKFEEHLVLTRHQGTVRIWQWTIFRIIEYRGKKKGLFAGEIELYVYFAPISMLRIDICLS